tara:strand:- start:3150 stop:4439 length:1290 start_codon:yes stop_codon:yes gene_type:complete
VLERPKGGEICVLVHVNFGDIDFQENNQEFIELVNSTDAEIKDYATGTRSSPDPKYYVGSGKLEEIKQSVDANKANLIIFNHELSPAQERNIEKACCCRVVDRIGLILDIFAKRAQTFEGKLQVELAQLEHMSTRLIRGWTHLERQKGGIGLRGPGETQLETDRRLLAGRISHIKQRLDKVRKKRNLSRVSRKKAEVYTVSLIGYTNAGKSTLFNSLLNAKQAYTANKLFATLDPKIRRLNVPGIGNVILVDTVGFINNLPHKLVSAFRATLEETVLSDLLLHVIDLSDPNYINKIHHVKTVLKEIKALNIATIEVYNKIDKLRNIEKPYTELDKSGDIQKVWVSSVLRKGMNLVKDAIANRLSYGVVHLILKLPFEYAKERSELYYENAVVNCECIDNNYWELEIKISIHKLNKIFIDDIWQKFVTSK